MLQVHSFAFLQSMDSTAYVCSLWSPWSYPSFAAVQRWYRGEGLIFVIAAPYNYYCFYEAKLSCSSWFFCFPSVVALHCIALLPETALKLPVFWSSRMLTSLRVTCASALPPLTIFRSLSALQRWQHCTQKGHRLQQTRRCCILAQHCRAAMMRSPALPLPQ